MNSTSFFCNKQFLCQKIKKSLKLQGKVESLPGGEHEEELLTAVGVELLNLSIAVLVRSLTVNSAVAHATVPAVIFQDVEHSEIIKQQVNKMFQLLVSKQII